MVFPAFRIDLKIIIPNPGSILGYAHLPANNGDIVLLNGTNGRRYSLWLSP